VPYTESTLPFSGITPQSRHTSRAGAEQAAPRAYSQAVRYLALLKHRGVLGLTDNEAAEILSLRVTSITARRVPLVKADLVKPCGFRKGPTGVKNVVWVSA
jgi:hypothetical protein